MKTIHLELPGQLAQELLTLVEKGLFVEEPEAARFAVRELIDRQRFQLLEDQQREDIAWVKSLKETAG